MQMNIALLLRALSLVAPPSKYRNLSAHAQKGLRSICGRVKLRRNGRGTTRSFIAQCERIRYAMWLKMAGKGYIDLYFIKDSKCGSFNYQANPAILYGWDSLVIE